MTETIVALATPNSQSALGIIRVSGRMVLELCEKIMRTPLPYPETRTFDEIYFTRAKYTRSGNHGIL